MSLIETALLVGLLYSLCTIGLSISFRVINYPDLTIEGSVILGGIFSYYGLYWGINPFISLIFGILGGIIAGLITAIIHNYLHVSKLLSGIITTALLYSINIRFLSGKSNIRFEGFNTIFYFLGNKSDINSIVIILLISLLLFILLILLFKTKLGYLLRILGDNESFLVSLGKDSKKINIIGLSIANGIIGLGGAILIQYKNIIDINSSAGLLVSCLASIVIGETILTPKNISSFLISGFIGTIVYQLIIAVILFSWNSQWDKFILSSDVRFVTGLLLIIPALLKYNQSGKYKLFKSEW
jgi:putative tryptophan/tyrosine transport system permease protein